jgi:hypothetical protein
MPLWSTGVFVVIYIAMRQHLYSEVPKESLEESGDDSEGVLRIQRRVRVGPGSGANACRWLLQC